MGDDARGDDDDRDGDGNEQRRPVLSREVRDELHAVEGRGVVEVHGHEHRRGPAGRLRRVRLRRARPAHDVQELEGQGEHADAVRLGHGEGAV